MSIPMLLISEILIAFLIGALPLFIMVKLNHGQEVIKYLVALNPGDPVVIYFFYLFLLHLVIWAINTYVRKTNQTASNFFIVAHKFSHQVGFTIHSIYRAIAGAIPAAIGLLAYKLRFDSKAFEISLASILLFFCSVFMCCLLTWLSDATAPKQKWL